MTEINLQFEALFAKRPELTELFSAYIRQWDHNAGVRDTAVDQLNAAKDIITEELGPDGYLFLVYTYWQERIRERDND